MVAHTVTSRHETTRPGPRREVFRMQNIPSEATECRSHRLPRLDGRAKAICVFVLAENPEDNGRFPTDIVAPTIKMKATNTFVSANDGAKEPRKYEMPLSSGSK